MSELVLALTNTPTRELARTIAERAVADGLAAAAQVLGPAASSYRWHGEAAHAQEWVCVLKTSTARLPAIEALLAAEHPYELPALLAIPVVDGSDAYLDWWRAQTTGG